MAIEEDNIQFDKLSENDLRFGNARKFLSNEGFGSFIEDYSGASQSPSGIGESGYHDIQPIAGPGIMTLNNKGQPCETCEECEECDEFIECEVCQESLINCNIDLVNCNDARRSLERLNNKYYDHIIILTGLYCGTWFQMRALMPTQVEPNGYFASVNSACQYQISDRLPVGVNVAFAVYESEGNPQNYEYYFTSSSEGSTSRWEIRGGVDAQGSTLVFGPIDANETGTAIFQFKPDVNCNFPLTLRVYSYLFPQFNGECSLGQLPCPTGVPQEPCPAPPIPT